MALAILKQLIRGPDRAEEATREPDIPVTKSDYGGALPYGWAATRQNGTIIWASQVERREASGQGGGKKGGGGKGRRGQKVWEYYQSVIVSFGQGARADGINRLWMDSKAADLRSGTLVIERDDDDPTSFDGARVYARGGELPVFNDPYVEIPVNSQGLRIDPVVREDQEDVDLDMLPAYTGHLLLCIQRLRLNPFGNRLPRFSAEVIYSQCSNLVSLNTVRDAKSAEVPYTADAATDIISMGMAARGRRLGFLIGSGAKQRIRNGRTTITARMVFLDINDPEKVLHDQWLADAVGNRDFTIPKTARILAMTSRRVLIGGITFERPAREGDPFNLVYEYVNNKWEFSGGQRGGGGGGGHRALPLGSEVNEAEFAAFTDNGGIIAAFDVGGRQHYRAYQRTEGASGGGGAQWQWNATSPLWSRPSGAYQIFAPAGVGPFAIGGFATADEIVLSRLQTGRGADPITTNRIDIAREITALKPEGAGLIGQHGSSTALLFIGSNRGLEILRISSDGKFTGDQMVLTGYTDLVDPHAFRSGTAVSNIFAVPMTNGNILAINWQCKQYREDARDVINASDALATPLVGNGALIYNEDLKRIVLRRLADPNLVYTMVMPLWSSGSVGAGAVLTDVAGQYGIAPSRVSDQTAEAETMQGLKVEQQTTGKNIMSAVLDITHTTIRETGDGRLALIDRDADRTPVLTFNADDLLGTQRRRGTEDTLRHTRADENEVPRVQELTYTSQDRDYQSSTASYRRPRATVLASLAEDRDSVSVPAVLIPAKAKTTVETILTRKWVERDFYQLTLPYRAVVLEPGDHIVVIDGDQRIVLATTSVEVSPIYTVVVEAVAHSVGLAELAGGDSEPGDPTPPGRPPGPTALADLTILDIPLLDDSHQSGATNRHTLYAATIPEIQPDGSWSGAAVYRVGEGDIRSELGSTTGGVAKGFTANALGDPVSPWRTDTVNTLDVQVVYDNDQIESVPISRLFDAESPANLCAIIRADGEVELIQYADAEYIESEDVWRLSTLLRGRRGTEYAAYGHEVGETVIFLNTAGILAYQLSVDGIEEEDRYVSLARGQSFDMEDIIVHTDKGRSKKPYAPVHVGAIRRSNGDILIYWTRRTRIGGGLRNHVGDVPVSEEGEVAKFDLEILDASDAVIYPFTRPILAENVLEWTGNQPSGVPEYATNGYVFSFRNQSAAGFFGDTLKVRVYQISAAVGRGFTETATVAVRNVGRTAIGRR